MSDIVFETARLIARRWDPDRDAEPSYVMYGDPEVTRYIGGETMTDVAASRARLEKALARYARFGEPFGSFPLFSREDGSLVGTAILKPLVDGEEKVLPEIEIGWHLRRSAWGQGYATEAGRALLARGFALTPDETLWAVVDPPNERSIAVARRLGMRHVGRTERYYGRDLELFALTREEYRRSS